MRLMVVGDTHGGQAYGGHHAKDRYVGYKAEIAKRMGADRMLIVGDFGMWPGVGGIEFLDDLEAIGRKYDIRIYALIGNHDDHDQWHNWIATGIKDDSGFTYVRSHILIAPKVHFWKWGGKRTAKRFGIAGGAVSVDRAQRTHGKSYWIDEPFGERHLGMVMKYGGPKLDYLFTHDCSDYTPFGFGLKVDEESKMNRMRIDKALAHLQPRYHFHGHMHARYDWNNDRSHGRHETAFGVDESEWNGCTTRTIGLECNDDKNSWAILDTGADVGKPDMVYWPSAAFTLLDKK